MRKIFSFLGLIMASLAVYAHENILVYVGPGAGPSSIVNTIATLEALASSKYIIKVAQPEDLIDPTWMQNTALLVMPGGADRPYLEKLTGKGNANIREYVKNGGKYLGICAGAYYSADRIEFAKGDEDLEVTGERELKFYPGLVEGPTYSGFDHRNTANTAGMRAATIYWNADQPKYAMQDVTLFYNGGGHFVNAEKYPEVIILARYGEEAPGRPDSPAAIVECTVGKGKAILSGPHFEWHAETLEGPEFAAIRAKLKQRSADRLIVAKSLLERLDIETVEVAHN